MFNSVSLDGYFTDASGDMGWAYQGSDDPEWAAFVAGNAKGGGQLLLGRVTYDMMAGFWPTPMALQTNPAVAEGMNRMPKFVASRTMTRPAWTNASLLKGDLAGAVRALKQAPGDDIVILGSGSLVAQLAPIGLIDEFQFVVNPVTLGAGRTLFAGLPRPVSLQLTSTRAFPNGKVVMCYQPA
jgi:dihydrofolate reductase